MHDPKVYEDNLHFREIKSISGRKMHQKELKLNHAQFHAIVA